MLPIRGDPRSVLIKRIRLFANRCLRSSNLATISALLFFLAKLKASLGTQDLLIQHMFCTSMLFACMWMVGTLFSQGVDRRLKLEGESRRTVCLLTYTFVIYLEIVKHTVGVSFSLGWIAGILACIEFLGEESLTAMFAGSLLVSLTAFIVTHGFSNFLDKLRLSDNLD